MLKSTFKFSFRGANRAPTRRTSRKIAATDAKRKNAADAVNIAKRKVADDADANASKRKVAANASIRKVAADAVVLL